MKRQMKINFIEWSGKWKLTLLNEAANENKPNWMKREMKINLIEWSGKWKLSLLNEATNEN
jgi:hypothetical protein